LGPLEKKLWVEQLWRRVISKSRAAALIVSTMKDLNKDIYLYGTKKGAYNSDDDVLVHKHWPSKIVLMPNSKIKTLWNIIMTILMIYTATFTPYWTAFIEDGGLALIIIDYIVDGLFFIDIIINFISAYEISNKELEVRLPYIAFKYFWTWFFLDLLAVFPLQALESVWEGGQYKSLVWLARLPWLYRLLRILWLFKMFWLVKYNWMY